MMLVYIFIIDFDVGVFVYDCYDVELLFSYDMFIVVVFFKFIVDLTPFHFLFHFYCY